MTSITSIVYQDRVQKALASFAVDLERLIDLTIEVQQIPAPTGQEAKRAQFVRDYFQSIGLADVSCDEISNVFGRLPGRDGSKAIVVSAHSDTVFPLDTDLTITRRDHKICGPGIADNSAGVSGLLMIANTIQTFDLQPAHDIWFVVNVGEEGLGNLLGMRAVTARLHDADAFIVVEGGMYGYVLHEAIGVQRYEIMVETAGGHSWSDFGRTSAIHVLGHLMSRIDKIPLPARPKTTYNVGVIEGGTSINTIASSARLQLDLRSEMPHGLAYMTKRVNQIVDALAHETGALITLTDIGMRPAGQLARSAPLIKQADAALRAVGCKQIHYLRGSTDANIPLSQGKNAVCIGLAQSANAHRLDETLDTTYLPQGMQQLLLLTLAAAQFEAK